MNNNSMVAMMTAAYNMLKQELNKVIDDGDNSPEVLEAIEKAKKDLRLFEEKIAALKAAGF